MFLLKKIVSPLFSPLSVVIGLLLIGLFLVWFTRKQKTGKTLITAGAAILLFLSYGFVSDCLIKTLERQYQPLMVESQHVVPANIGSVKWIVLLGGGHTYDQELPVTSQISEASLVRLAEAIRIYKKIPNCKIILSGGAVFSPFPEAMTLSRVAQMLNVSSGDIVLDSDSKDTGEQALRISSIVGQDSFVLVTSAYHMPRSVALLKKIGLTPIPAPTNHSIFNRQSIQPSDFYPSYGGLQNAEKAVHEYLGILWLKLQNKL